MKTLSAVLSGLITVIVLLLSQAAHAQDSEESCSALVQKALTLTQETCQATTGRNQACYGNISLLAEPQPGINNLEFEQQGDIADVDMIRTLQLSAMNAANNEWGVAYLQLQANLPDDTAQNVTLLMFGEVKIENAVEPVPELATIAITSNGNLNVRGGPSTNHPVVSTLAPGDTVTADGRIEDGSWLRIRLEDDMVGWVFAQLVTTEGDIVALSVVDPDSEVESPRFGPLQAFFVETGVDDAPCATAPDSGLLIQTPEGVGEINLVVNEVDIKLRSTAYIQSQAGAEMIVSLVEGNASVSALGTTVFTPAGTRVRIDMDTNNNASSVPGDPEPYDETALAALPVGYLARSVGIATALSQEEIETFQQGTPIPGQWLYTNCLGDSKLVEYRLTDEGLIGIDTGGDFETLYNRTEPGVYVFTNEFGNSAIYRVITPTLMEITLDPYPRFVCGDAPYAIAEYVGPAE
jgi:uncharacterized protein YgiM (DUF1202 family)